MAPELALTDVGQAFHEHEVLLTGANGFLGKVILGLILDRFPDFKHLHILLRRRGEVGAAVRLLNRRTIVFDAPMILFRKWWA